MSSTTLEYTYLSDIESIHTTLRSSFRTGKSKNLAFRKHQLLQLARLAKENEDRFNEALQEDLGRPSEETFTNETSLIYRDALDAYRNVNSWAKASTNYFSFGMHTIGTRSTIRREPKGVVLIISPYNYPARLCLSPLAGAIAAGNAAVIKPSEYSKATSALLAELLPRYLDSDFYRVVNGGVPETTKLLELHWDHIMYFGGHKVGRIILTAAVKYLTPVTLELGGKNPVIVDADFDMMLAAKRILWGKVVNAGQNCVSPDYVLIPAEARDKFVESLRIVYKKFFPDGKTLGTVSRLISDSHFDKMDKLLKTTKGDIVLGGETDASRKYVAPTVVINVDWSDCLMEDEIFGPILPIVSVSSIDEAISAVSEREHPLGLYLFSDNKALVNKVLSNTQSGGVIINDSLLQHAVIDAPIGGIGASGMGNFNGKYSFDTFTHLRTTLYSPRYFDIIAGIRFPPYKKAHFLIKSLFMPPLPRGVAGNNSNKWGKWLLAAFLVSLMALYSKKSQLFPTGVRQK